MHTSYCIIMLSIMPYELLYYANRRCLCLHPHAPPSQSIPSGPKYLKFERHSENKFV